MNVFTFSGNLGRDVKVNQAGGSTVANFVVAVKSGYGDREQTLWVDCSLWGKRAEGGLPQYLTKGQTVMVSGELGIREYQDNDGNNKTVLTCNVANITLAGAKGDNSNSQHQQPQRQQQAQPQQQAPSNNFDDFDDDIPF